MSTVQSTGGLLSGMLSSSSSGSTGAEKNSDGTVTVRYKLPYASMFVKNVDSYIAAYDEANPDAPMEYDYTPLKESIPWMEILFYLPCWLHRFPAVLHDARRRCRRRHHERGQGPREG